MRIHPETAEIIQSNWLRCHSKTVSEISTHDSGRDYWNCHCAVAHGERGITLLPVQDSIIYPVEEERGHEWGLEDVNTTKMVN